METSPPLAGVWNVHALGRVSRSGRAVALADVSPPLARRPPFRVCVLALARRRRCRLGRMGRTWPVLWLYDRDSWPKSRARLANLEVESLGARALNKPRHFKAAGRMSFVRTSRFELSTRARRWPILSRSWQQSAWRERFICLSPAPRYLRAALFFAMLSQGLP